MSAAGSRRAARSRCRLLCRSTPGNRPPVCAAAGAERRHTTSGTSAAVSTVRKLSIKPLGKVNTVNTPCAWSLRIPGRRLDFEQPRGVTFGVAAEHQDELIGGRHLRRRPCAVLAQRILRRSHVLQRSSARRFEVLDRLRPGDDFAGRLELCGGLELRYDREPSSRSRRRPRWTVAPRAGRES